MDFPLSRAEVLPFVVTGKTEGIDSEQLWHCAQNLFRISWIALPAAGPRRRGLAASQHNLCEYLLWGKGKTTELVHTNCC